MEANIRNNEKLIAHQNLQIEFLQEKNHQLEMRVQEFIDAKHKNEDLKRNLHECNRIAKKAEFEKQVMANAADRKLDQAKYQIERTQEEMNNLDSAMHQLELVSLQQ